jgi:ubiquinone/menaquinone biosynthesis C-methylase UbiE
MSKPRDEYLCGVGKSGHSRLSIINAGNQTHINLLLSKLNLKPGMNVLDIACGTGEISCLMAERHPLAHIVAIDFSDEQIKIAAENAAIKQLQNITFLVMSAYDIKNLQERYQFDRIFIRWVLGHLKDPQLVVDSCKTLLKPHGMIICEEGNIQTHHCVSANPSFQQTYGFFVSKILSLQKKRGVDAEIGAKLPAMFRKSFQDLATIETDEHQLLLESSIQKEAVTTSFLNEVGQKFTDEPVLTPEQLNDLKSDLDIIAHDSEAKILYTKDISVVIKLR